MLITVKIIFQGAFVGLAASVVINMWIGIGAVLYGKAPKLKPMSTENCNYLNRTNIEYSSFSNRTIDVSNTFGYFYFIQHIHLKLEKTAASINSSVIISHNAMKSKNKFFFMFFFHTERNAHMIGLCQKNRRYNGRLQKYFPKSLSVNLVYNRYLIFLANKL